MTKRQFVVLAFRLFALYLFFELLPHIGYLFNFMAPGGRSWDMILSESFAICVILFFISLLWARSEWLMHKVFAIPALSDDVVLVKDEPYIEGQVEGVSEKIPDVIEIQDYGETPLSKESIELVVFSAIGLWTVFHQLPEIARDSSFLFSASTDITNPFSNLLYNRLTRERLIEDLIPVILGIWLFLRPWQFQAWIEKFKPKPDEAKITSQE